MGDDAVLGEEVDPAVVPRVRLWGRTDEVVDGEAEAPVLGSRAVEHGQFLAEGAELLCPTPDQREVLEYEEGIVAHDPEADHLRNAQRLGGGQRHQGDPLGLEHL